ncbi:hypothetical protein [Nocardioides sp. NPDC047086]|uniref:hypothetical protein n=1 Tax=Nocardioides sp. NPDC047086 TaxID=3154810 RepID=UPI0033D57FF4
MSRPSSARRRIAFLLFDGVKTLDYVGPAEVFVEANQAVDGYDILLLSPDGEDVVTSLAAGSPCTARPTMWVSSTPWSCPEASGHPTSSYAAH